jgi:methionyl aminopeptidase
VSIETPDELAGMQAAGAAVAATIREVRRHVRPGVSTAELDRIAARTLQRHGARSAPQLVYRFPGHICISVGDAAVHGVPNARRLREGDVVTIDVTAERDGFFADAATTVGVGGLRPRVKRLLACSQAALHAALGAAKAGAPVSAIGAAAQAEVHKRGFTVMHELCGHGIGRTIHEDPNVPNVPGAPGVLTEGLVIAVEPIIADGDTEYVEDPDGWTLRTRGGSMAAHAEHTIVVRDGRPLVLTA